MDIYMFAFCLLPIIALIGTIIVMVRERRDEDHRHHSGPWG